MNKTKIIFHIGYHKTGTSWLQRVYFPEHPQILPISNSQRPWQIPFLSYLITTSDGNFDHLTCRNLLKKQLDEIDTFSQNKVFLVSAERLSGHPISGGFDSFRIAERIKSCFENVAIICVIRDQVNMIRSVYKQMVAQGYPGDIESLLNTKCWKTVSYDPSFYEYDILVRKYQNLFDSNQVYVQCYEKMFAEPESFLSDLCHFIRVPYYPIAQQEIEKRVNVSLPGASLGAVRFLNHFRETELNPFPLFKINHRMYNIAKTIFRKTPLKKDPLSKNNINKIRSYYRESNKRLKEIVDDELFHYIKDYLG